MLETQETQPVQEVREETESQRSGYFVRGDLFSVKPATPEKPYGRAIIIIDGKYPAQITLSPKMTQELNFLVGQNVWFKILAPKLAKSKTGDVFISSTFAIEVYYDNEVVEGLTV